MIKGYRIKILPNEEQKKKIISFCHASRFAYNWALNIEEENYKNGNKFISGYDLTKLFTQFKKLEGNEWLKEVSGRATKGAILNLANAYDRFFKKIAERPRFKVKSKSKMKCSTHEGTTLITYDKVRLEGLGWVKLTVRGYIPIGDTVKYSNHKIEFDGIDFWFSVGASTENNLTKTPKTKPIGLDLGIKTLIVTSENEELKKPNLKKAKKKLKRLQKKASRTYEKMIMESKITKTKFKFLPKSKNLYMLEKEIKKVHIHIKDKLTTNIHEFTSHLVKLNPEAIAIEDLNVRGMMKNKHLSEKIAEAKFYEIRRQLEYKCLWNDVKLIIADRWFPSSKTCSNCGTKKAKLSLSERVFKCDCCGFEMDRDLNASINLRNLAYVT